MKQCYQEAQMEIVYFEVFDLIATSAGSVETTAEWVPRDCESAPDYDAFVDL